MLLLLAYGTRSRKTSGLIVSGRNGNMGQRIIGEYEGSERGPLLICIGAMHGNEPAGVKALEMMFKMLEVEPIINESFHYRGKIVGVIGNTKAYAQKKRFLEKDLNRQFREMHIEKIRQQDKAELENEDLELRELLEFIEDQIRTYKPEKLYILDLHTTSSRGGIFCLTTNDDESIDIAVNLHAPVVKGFLKGIRGTTLHYFKEENTKVPTVALTFESGQHDEPLSINRAIAAVTNCMRIIGSVRVEDVENRHDKLLNEYSKNLPKVSELLRRHDITPEAQFKMRPNFKNFQRLSAGEIIADDINGPIDVQEDCLLIMPLYQTQGEEGFFLIKETTT